MDLCFDKDIIELLLEIKISNEPENKENYSIHYDEASAYSMLLNNKEKFITNYYTSHITSLSEYETVKNLVNKLDKDVRVVISLCSTYPEIERILQKELKHTSNLYLMVDLNKDLLTQFHKGHKYNIKKGSKLNIESRCYYKEDVPENIMEEFYKAILFSRGNIGGIKKKPYFKHSSQSFIIRKELIKKGKAILTRVEYDDKISFIFSLISNNNGRYFDSGYINRTHPYTAHYAHFELFKTISSEEKNYYGLGEINEKDCNQINDLKGTLYYKKGFCKHPLKVYELINK